MALEVLQKTDNSFRAIRFLMIYFILTTIFELLTILQFQINIM